jgi:DNA polymerase-1
MEKKLMVIDGNSLMHRAFYALPPLTNAKGEFTHAVFGFFSMLIKAVQENTPDYVAVAFDMKGKTFRHDKFTEYKAGRKETPPELIPQFPLLKDTLKKLGIPVVEKEGMEADDFLGSLAKAANQKDIHVILVTGDRDAFQLINDKTTVFLTRKGISETENYDEAKLFETYGISPAQVVDFKGLMGDASDNIPGVPGVGEKTALKLIHAWQSIDGMYNNIDKIEGKLKERLIVNKELAYLSREIATIDSDIPLEQPVEALAFQPLTVQKARAAFEELGFKSLLKRLPEDEKQELHIANTIEPDEITVNNMQQLREMIRELLAAHRIALIFGTEIYIASDENAEYKIECAHSLLNMDFGYDAVMQEIKPLLENNQNKILHAQKDTMHRLGAYDISLVGDCFDVMIAAYVLDPTGRDYSLDALREKYGAKGNAAALFMIANAQEREMKKNGTEKIFNTIETPLICVLYDMELEGFTVDTAALNELSEKYQELIDSLTEEIYGLCGGAFNINSTKQLGEVLFDKLQLPSFKKTKTGYSTDSEVLEALADAHPVVQKITDYRQVAKLKSTYIEGIRALLNNRTHRIHTTFKQETTVTGRISSIEPNLQNIPIRTEMGREIRRIFVPSDDQRIIIAADYSQIELRVLAHISDDEVMIEAFKNNEDIHRRTAAEVFDVAPEDVTTAMRSSAKAVNFGIVYGISDFGLAKNLSISRKQASAYIEKYLSEFSGVKKYMDEIKTEAKANGYVKTLFGRIRRIDELKSGNYNVRSFGERAALNTPIQGTAADIIKYAMIRVHDALIAGGYKSRLILQVHDELIIDACMEEQEEVARLLREKMETAADLKLPLVANVSQGRNWFEAK